MTGGEEKTIFKCSYRRCIVNELKNDESGRKKNRIYLRSFTNSLYSADIRKVFFLFNFSGISDSRTFALIFVSGGLFPIKVLLNTDGGSNGRTLSETARQFIIIIILSKPLILRQ